MSGKIKVLKLSNGITSTATGLEYGLSLSRTVPPNAVQLSNEFVGLADGKYYIWYRTVGSNWNENDVLTEVVTCAAAQNIQALVNNFYQNDVLPAIQAIDANYQALAELSITNIKLVNLPANVTTSEQTLAVSPDDEFDTLELVKVVAVFINGQNVVYENNLPGEGDTATQIYLHNGSLYWRGGIAGYELAATDTVTLMIAK